MSFIAINARADVQGSKKGKLTPAQHAQLNAWCLSNKTGILDCLGRCEYDNQQTSLIVIDNKVNIVFKSGYVVICGRLVECEGSTTFTLDNLANSQEGSIVLRYDLENFGEQEFVITKKIGVLDKQDLNDNPITGKYDFELYSYKVQSNEVKLTRNFEYIRNVQEIINDLTYKRRTVSLTSSEDLVVNGEFTELANSCFCFTIGSNNINIKGLTLPIYAKGTWIGTGKDIVVVFDTSYGQQESWFYNTSYGTWQPNFSLYAKYASEDTSKGTIEERLTALGFSVGSVTGASGVTLTKIGKYAILRATNLVSVTTDKDGYVKLELSYKSNETFELAIPITNTGQMALFNFTKNSNIVTIFIGGSYIYTGIRPFSIGFEISL